METLVFGAGYVGLVQAAGLASTGNHVFLADISEERVRDINAGKCPIHEPQLPELLQKARSQDLIKAVLVGTDEFKDCLKRAEIIFIAVQTPQSDDGSANLEYVMNVVDSISTLEGDLSDKIVVTKSTVPVGTGDKVEAQFQKHGKKPVVASNPEFLKQGAAVDDFLKPERVVIGTDNERAREVLSFLYHPFMLRRERIICMSRKSAELVKYACNAFLATKISFINEIAQLSERVGADVRDIRKGMITDSRIGDKFLFPGVGYGGSCFPKDTVSLMHQGKSNGITMQIPTAVDAINRNQRNWAYEKLKKSINDLSGKKVAIWGLSFKPNTDDLREAPSITLIRQLLQEKATISATDPVTIPKAKLWLKEELQTGGLSFEDDPYKCVEAADALVVLTEWHEFRSPAFPKLGELMNNKLLIDGRNLYGPEIARQYDFTYFGVGVGS